jgi:serine/threonine-protein kinase HipA
MRTCLDLLGGSAQADTDRAHFTLTQLAFWLLAATDGHAKNFSIFHNRGGSFGLTPLYDVISAWPIIGNGPYMISEHDAKLAMALHSKNTHYKLREIRVRHWVALANRCGAPGVWEQMLQMVHSVDACLVQVQGRLPNDFPAHVWDTVKAGMRRHAEQFLREVEGSNET